MEKKINYLSRDFASIKNELIKFSNQYYPEVADDFTDSSIGAWLIDLVSAVGDDLSYHTDRMFQETNINSANLRSTLLNLARTNGVKVPGAKCSMCEVEVSCVLPVDGDNPNIAQPNWNYAPIVQRTSLFSAGNQNFELIEDINFAEQFNSDGFSNRKIMPSRDSNGNVTGYTVSKSTIAINGTSKVYKRVLTSSDIKPFMEVVLPEANITNIESVIFKETSDITRSPEIYEYFIDAEEYRLSTDAVMTYRYFEMDSLADQYRFGMVGDFKNQGTGKELNNIYKPHLYDDYTEYTSDNKIQRTTRYYRGAWKPVTQKFITEFTDNGYMKLIFGCGNGYPSIPDSATTYGDYMASNLVNNDMLGILPKEGWTMYVLYRVGGGVSTNLGPGSITTISDARIDWGGNTGNTNGAKRGQVISSLAITNISTAMAGKDAPSNEEIKYLIKYNTSSQNRAVTVKDYKAKLMQMPPKFGAPFRNTVIESNNKVEMSFIGLNAEGQLDSALPQTLIENVMEYMSNYRQINDYIEIKSGKIYNIGIEADVFVDKNYNTADVIANVIDKIKEYFSVDNHDMGEDIFVGDLEKEISLVDGVISLIELRVFKLRNNGYSPDECPLPTVVQGGVCESSMSSSFKIEGMSDTPQIDLEQIDHVLYADYNSMYEIKKPTTDIQIRCKIR